MQEEQQSEERVIAIMRRKFAEDEAKERAEELARKEARVQYIKLIEQQKNERKGYYDEERLREVQEVRSILSHDGDDDDRACVCCRRRRQLGVRNIASR